MLNILAIPISQILPAPTHSVSQLLVAFHRIELTSSSGLAISDFWMAVNFMGSAATQLAGHALEGASCSINGFSAQWFVIQSMSFFESQHRDMTNHEIADYWVLVIAVCTFFMLADFTTQSEWIQSHRWFIWALPCGLSALWAAVGLGVAGYGNIGACKFSPSLRMPRA